MAHHPEYSYIDPETGNRIWAGPLEITPGDHHHMPQRDASYPSSEYERGHNNPSSLGGGNGRDNTSAQHRVVNRGAMRAVERGETDFNTLGLWFRVYFDLGVREQDHRGMVKAIGAAN